MYNSDNHVKTDWISYPRNKPIKCITYTHCWSLLDKVCQGHFRISDAGDYSVTLVCLQCNICSSNKTMKFLLKACWVVFKESPCRKSEHNVWVIWRGTRRDSPTWVKTHESKQVLWKLVSPKLYSRILESILRSHYWPLEPLIGLHKRPRRMGQFYLLGLGTFQNKQLGVSLFFCPLWQIVLECSLIL